MLYFSFNKVLKIKTKKFTPKKSPSVTPLDFFWCQNFKVQLFP